MTDLELIQLTLADPNASEVELELADRLGAALAECDRLAGALTLGAGDDGGYT